MDKNLTIHINGTAPKYSVVASCDDSQVSGELHLVALHADLDGHWSPLGPTRDMDVAVADSLEVSSADPRPLGAKLYAHLFAGPVGRLLDRALVGAQQGVRIRLIVDASEHDAPENAARLAGVPWEILTRERWDTPLAFDRRTVLVRTIPFDGQEPPIPFTPPLRVLLIVSNPAGTEPLALANEQERLKRTFEEVRGVQVDVVTTPTKDAIMKMIAESKYHVVHFMGHGDFDPRTGRGAVLLERADGSVHRMEADEFRAMLLAAPPRLVFLNACKTAAASARTAINPFGGMATSLMLGGIPAVVAMQFPISDAAAITFSTAFYQRLVKGTPVDDAVSFGRARLYSPDDAEWATPVLYMRPTHGMLFEVDGAPPADAEQRVTGPASVPHVEAAPNAVPVPNAPPSPAAATSSEFKVFLAATSRSVRHRAQIIKELRASGITVLPSVPNLDESDEAERAGHDERLIDVVRQADLCVHVLAGDAGEELSDADVDAAEPDTFPVRQLDVCGQLLRPQYVLLDATAPLESIVDARYRAFLERQQRVHRDGGEFELDVDRLTQVGTKVIAKRDRMLDARRRAEEAAHRATAKPHAFIDVHVDDVEESFALQNHLRSKGITPVVVTAMDDPNSAENSADADQFERYVRSAPMVILFYGNVGYNWISSRLELASKIAIKQRLKTRIGVYVAPPLKHDDDLPFARMFPTARNASGFDSAEVDRLLSEDRP